MAKKSIKKRDVKKAKRRENAKKKVKTVNNK
jgi:hypothetical protein